MPRSRLLPLLAAPLCAAGIYYTPSPLTSPPTPASDFHPSLHPQRFTPWTIISHQPLSPSSAILVLRPPIPPPSASSLYKGGTWSVEAKNSSLSVGRRYTPFPPLVSELTQHGDVAIFLRGIGETSRLLLRTPVGGEVPLRGPGEELSLPADAQGEPVRVDRALVLAGGTGLAPALQLGEVLLGQERAGTMTVLWAQRGDAGVAVGDQGLEPGSGWGRWWRAGASEHGEDNGIVRYLADLKSRFRSAGGRLETAYLASGDLTGGYVGRIVNRIEDRSVKEEDETHGSGMKLLVVSGPEGFVDYLAGPKVWANGQERQGPLGGVLGQLKRQGKLDGWRVWKL